MHHTVPVLAGRGTEEREHGGGEGLEVGVAVEEEAMDGCTKESHSDTRVDDEEEKHQQTHVAEGGQRVHKRL